MTSKHSDDGFIRQTRSNLKNGKRIHGNSNDMSSALSSQASFMTAEDFDSFSTMPENSELSIVQPMILVNSTPYLPASKSSMYNKLTGASPLLALHSTELSTAAMIEVKNGKPVQSKCVMLMRLIGFAEITKWAFHFRQKDQ